MNLQAMFILESTQVKPCYVNNQGKSESGIRAYGKAFRMLATYQPAQAIKAMAHCRSCLDGNALSIIIKNPIGYTVWLQSPERVGEAST